MDWRGEGMLCKLIQALSKGYEILEGATHLIKRKLKVAIAFIIDINLFKPISSWLGVFRRKFAI